MEDANEFRQAPCLTDCSREAGFILSTARRGVEELGKCPDGAAVENLMNHIVRYAICKVR